MAVKFENEDGWLLCHESYINYAVNELDSKPINYQLKNELFNVKTPFIMDSQAQKLASKDTKEETKAEKRRKRKKEKYKNNLNNQLVINAAKNIISSSNYFKTRDITLEEIKDNNRTARTKIECLHKVLDLISLPENDLNQHYFELNEFQGSIESILPSLIANKTQLAMKIKLRSEDYLIPPNSAFILANLDYIEKILMSHGEKFDVILLDPPWENKSIKRLKKYNTLSKERLLKISVPNLSNEGCLIIIWTTNNFDQNSFVKDVLFPNWSVKYVTDLHWVKVTKNGDFAIPLESPNKCVYENIIIGQFSTNSTEIPNKLKGKKVIVSVPSLIHSHKPPLTEILKPYLKTNFKGLEIFARYLLPGWTSCGNEVLKLQNINYYNY